MLFSSLLFVFFFLPIVLGLYYTIGRKSMQIRNLLLLAASLFFYAWGEPKHLYILLLSVIINYLFALKISSNNNIRIKRGLLHIDIALNLSLLFVFKYLNFTISSINMFFGAGLPQTNIALPIGISFFTFQAMSYVIDVYRGKVEVQRDLSCVALYISFFPQLIAGPIVRYSTIEHQINNRIVTWDSFSIGVRRFILGFSKKIILANNLAVIADKAFSITGDENLSFAMAWLGAIAYTLQIYYDFSAYSDMAIGLGKMFGFNFLENFNYPYISKSISEFWRRWHMSLGEWFRDYVYFPLGGSRVESKVLLVRNLLIVWLLTGIWHGANWTFIAWGLLQFIFIAFEKLTNITKRLSGNLSQLYRIVTLLVIVLGWVLFRAESIASAGEYIRCMLYISKGSTVDNNAVQYLMEYKIILILGVIFSVDIFGIFKSKIDLLNKYEIQFPGTIVYCVLFIVSVSYLVMGAYNPFIYFNF